MPLTAEIRASIKARKTGSADFAAQDYAPEIEAAISLLDGVAANQADILFADERTVASASNDDLDLAGVLADAFGATIAGAELVALMIINKPKTPGAAANTTNLTIGVGTNPVTPGFMGGTNPTIGPLRPGGVLLLACPDAAGLGVITGGSADVLRIANSAGAAATYQIVVIARSA